MKTFVTNDLTTLQLWDTRAVDAHLMELGTRHSNFQISGVTELWLFFCVFTSNQKYVLIIRGWEGRHQATVDPLGHNKLRFWACKKHPGGLWRACEEVGGWCLVMQVLVGPRDAHTKKIMHVLKWGAVISEDASYKVKEAPASERTRLKGKETNPNKVIVVISIGKKLWNFTTNGFGRDC